MIQHFYPGIMLRMMRVKYFHILSNTPVWVRVALKIFEFLFNFLLYAINNTNSTSLSSRVEFELSYMCVCVCHFLLGTNGTLMFTDEALLMSRFPSFSIISLACMTLWESHHLCVKQLFLSQVMDWIHLETSSTLAPCCSVNLPTRAKF